MIRSKVSIAPLISLLICVAHICILSYLARQHPFGTFATETDFYHYYAPDAERIAAGQFPSNTYLGPGYPTVIALAAKISGSDLFTVGKWMSVICAALCGFLTFNLFAQIFNKRTGLGAQSILVVSGLFPQFSINATTDVFFLLLCLASLNIFLDRYMPVVWRVAGSAFSAALVYMTRYNGLFLFASFLIGILLLNVFAKSRTDRLRLTMIFVAVFLITASPWLYWNYKHQGSPFYNTNYLNIATEFYPELVAGKTNQDGTRALEQKFHSFGDVLQYDPRKLIARYPVNLWESIRNSVTRDLVNNWVAGLACLGIAIALIVRRTKSVWMLLVAGSVYLLLMALSHWETRYYFFVLALYAGFAAYAPEGLLESARNWGWLKHPAFDLIPISIIALLVAISFAESRKDVKEFLGSHPMEVIAARDYINSQNTAGARLRILARKPHLPYLSRNEWVFFPQVKSIDEFHAWIQNNRVDYIAIGKRELKERKELAALGDPKKAPEWLKVVWVHEDPDFILYKTNQ